MGSKITYITSYLPEKVFSNKEFFELFPEMKENSYVHKIGVENRVIATNQTASDLALEAGLKLLKEQNLNTSDIDFLIYSSTDFDYYMPATSCVLHHKLKLKKACGTIDITHGCSAYVYALAYAQGLIDLHGYKNILLLNANTLTKKLHPKDKASRFVFGDGAAATLIQYDDTNYIGKAVFGTDSDNFEKIIVRDGFERMPLNENSYIDYADEYGNITNNAHYYMDGSAVFLFTIRRVPEIISEVLAKNNLTIHQIDWFIFHQANQYIIDTIGVKMEIPKGKIFTNLKHIGNTVGASIPIAYAELCRNNQLKSNQKVLLVGFGVGLSLSANIITIP